MSQSVLIISSLVPVHPSVFCDLVNDRTQLSPKPLSQPRLFPFFLPTSQPLGTVKPPPWISVHLSNLCPFLHIYYVSLGSHSHSLSSTLSMFLEKDRCFSRTVLHDYTSQSPTGNWITLQRGNWRYLSEGLFRVEGRLPEVASGGDDPSLDKQ